MMTDGLKGNGHEEALIKYWMEKARESLESAESEYLVKELLDQAKGFVGEMEKLLIQSTDL